MVYATVPVLFEKRHVHDALLVIRNNRPQAFAHVCKENKTQLSQAKHSAHKSQQTIEQYHHTTKRSTW
jgi:hypothetical protein